MVLQTIGMILGMILLVIVAIAIIFLIYYYPLRTFASLFFSYQERTLPAAISSGLIIFLIISTIAVRVYPHLITQSAYILSATVVGLFFLSIPALIIYHTLKAFVKIQKKYARIALLGIVIVLFCVGLIGGLTLQTEEIEIPFSIEQEIRIIHLSDIHLGAVHDVSHMQRIVQKANALSPDIVVITGDLFDGSTMPSQEAVRSLDSFDSPVFVVFGNHEFYEGESKIYDALEQTDVIILRNEVIQLDLGLSLIGADDPSFGIRLEQILDELMWDESMPSVLLYHQPKDIDIAAKRGIGLILSGHTHKGQIFPFTIAAYLGNNFYLSGLYKIGNTTMHVSQGAGTWGPPLRLGSRNTITLIRLVPD